MLLRVPFAMLLLVQTDVGGCGCPISLHVTWSKGVTYELRKIAAIMASIADDMIFLIILVRTVMAPLMIYKLPDLFPRTVYPLALLLTLLVTRSAVLLWEWMIMSLAL